MRNKTTFAEFSTDAVVGQQVYTDIPPNWKKIIRVRIGNRNVEFESRLRDNPPALVLKKVPTRYDRMVVFVEQYVSKLLKT